VFKRLTADPPLRSGERLSHATYDQYKGSLERAAATYGYLDARMLRSEMQVDLGTHKANIFLQLDSGERYFFGATTIEQSAVRASVVRRFLRYHEGEPYNALLLLRTQFALDDSQYYSTVEVQAGDRDPVHHTVPITIRANNARRGYSFGAGYGTDTGFRGTIAWTVPRVNSYGHRFRVQMELSQIEQLFDARYDIPVGDPAVEKLSLDLLGQQADYGENVTGSQIAFAPSLTQISGNWQRIVSTGLVHTITDDPIEGRRVDNVVVPSIVFASIPEGYLGEALFSRGLYAQLEGSTTQLGARANFLRLDLQGERVVNLSPRWHLLLRSEVGASSIGNIENLPGQYRFFAGGDRSVRGFAYDDLSPVSISAPTRNALTGVRDPGPAGQGGWARSAHRDHRDRARSAAQFRRRRLCRRRQCHGPFQRPAGLLGRPGHAPAAAGGDRGPGRRPVAARARFPASARPRAAPEHLTQAVVTPIRRRVVGGQSMSVVESWFKFGRKVVFAHSSVSIAGRYTAAQCVAGFTCAGFHCCCWRCRWQRSTTWRTPSAAWRWSPRTSTAASAT
jgi:hypothetical protein